MELDPSTVEPVRYPKRPQDRILLRHMKKTWQEDMLKPVDQRGFGLKAEQVNTSITGSLEKHDETFGFNLKHGDVVLAPITSCTNTSNPACS
ncbi:MAG: aconitase family protein [Deinococcales bacterium]